MHSKINSVKSQLQTEIQTPDCKGPVATVTVRKPELACFSVFSTPFLTCLDFPYQKKSGKLMVSTRSVETARNTGFMLSKQPVGLL